MTLRNDNRTLRVAPSLLLVLVILLSSCSKEKAKAVQEAAIRLDEASAATSVIVNEWRSKAVRPGGEVPGIEAQLLAKAGTLIRGNSSSDIHVPSTKDIKDVLDALLEDNRKREVNLAGLRRATELARQNTESLHRAYLFADDPLKEMKKPLEKVAASYYNLANRINDIPTTFEPSDQATIIRLARSATSRADLQGEVAVLLASSLADREEQEVLKGKAIAACLETSRRALTLVKLIEEFDRLSAADLLSIAGDFSPLAAVMTGGRVTDAEFDSAITDIKDTADKLNIDLTIVK